MRSLPFDQSITAFDSEPIGIRDSWALLLEFFRSTVRFFIRNLLAVFCVCFCIMTYTELSLYICSLMIDQPWYDLRAFANYGRPLFSLFPLVIILVGLYDLRSEIAGIANLSRHTDFPGMTWTFVLLGLSTYIVIEAVFGWGSGNSWASDYVTAYFAAWALRTIVGWPVYRRHILSHRDVEFHRRKARRSFAAKRHAFLLGQPGGV